MVVSLEINYWMRCQNLGLMGSSSLGRAQQLLWKDLNFVYISKFVITFDKFIMYQTFYDKWGRLYDYDII